MAGLTESEQREQMERFATEVAPVLRKEVASDVWETNKAKQPNVLNV